MGKFTQNQNKGIIPGSFQMLNGVTLKNSAFLFALKHLFPYFNSFEKLINYSFFVSIMTRLIRLRK